MSAFKRILKGFIIFTLFPNNVVVAQINGEFWWLNNKFAALNGAEVPEAQFEELDEFANDETDMIVFRDKNEDSHSDLIIDISKIDKNRNKNSEELSLHFPSSKENEGVNNNNIYSKSNESSPNIVSQPINYKQTNKSDIQIDKYKFQKNSLSDKGNLHEHESIVFPSEISKTIKIVGAKIPHSDNPLSNRYDIKKITQSEINSSNATSDAEYICHYVTKEVCTQKNGYVYKDSRSLYSNGCSKKKTVCCVLPIQSNTDKEKLLQEVMPGNKAETTEVNAKVNIRFPRSARDIAASNRGQTQRDVLLRRLFHINPKTTSATTILKKIVNPDDDYIDPYWNIKDSNLKSHQKGSRPVVNSYEYDTVETDEDYASELPKPGLGSYPGQPTRPPLPISWTDYYINPGPSYYNVHGSAVGSNYNSYTTLDPRQDHRVSLLSSKLKPAVPSSEEIYDSESQIVTYQANPDFQVLQDFKLLNLIRNRSRVRDEKSRKTTTEHYYSEESVSITRPGYGGDSDVVYDEVDDLGKQLHENCRKRAGDYDYDTEEIGSGGHSWLILVVRTRMQRRSLCSATLVHPRAALTAASCVYGASHGEVVIRAGERDPGKDPQQRLTWVYANPLYQPGTINHNLAILYWKRPLRTGTGVQPAYLKTVVKPQDSCNLMEWHLSKQATRPQLRVQHATVLTRQTCIEHLSKVGILDEVPNGAFCITTLSNRCTSKVGGVLHCSGAVVGVAVRRARCDSPSLLLPTYGWTRHALAKLHIF